MKKNNLKYLLLLVLFIVLTISLLGADSDIIVDRKAEWKYSDIGEIKEDWKSFDYNDSNWKIGKSPLGYGDDYSETDPKLPIGTVVGFGEAENKYMTTYFRKIVEIENPESVKDLEIFVHVDDGAIVYINGVELFRRGIDSKDVNYMTTAKFKPKEESFKLSGNWFKKGKNIIAAEVHQDSLNSSDLWFELGIKNQNFNEDKKIESTPVIKTKIEEPKTEKVSKITVTFTGDTKFAKGFTWYTSQNYKKSDLEIIEKTGTIVDFSKALKFRGYTTISENSKDEYLHKAEAIGLKEGTTYFFRVGDSSKNFWSETGSFKTAMKKAKFTFIDVVKPYNVNGLDFSETVTVSRTNDDENLVSKKLYKEVYAKNIGSIYKEEWVLTNTDFDLPPTWPDRAGSGYIMTAKVLEYCLQNCD